jgi:hypothetical protein
MDYASSVEWAEQEEIIWSKYEVLQVLFDHGALENKDASFPEMIKTLGDKAEYAAADVLAWLGY